MNAPSLSLGFKGGRSYLHGTDIFNATVDRLQSLYGTISNIDLSLHRVCSRQIALEMNQEPEKERTVAICRYMAGGQRLIAYLVDTGIPVTEHFPYDEDQITGGMVYDLPGRSASLDILTPYTRIEIWIAMVKALHLSLYREHGGQWLFVRAHFSEYCQNSDSGPYGVKLTSSLGTKLTSTDIYQGKRKAGKIFFSLTPQK